jgi:hypothetical protein
MNDKCIEMRERMESSIGFALEPKERDEIERHCAQCEPCRAYRERLLGDDSLLAELVAPCSESVRRVQEGTIERLRAARALETCETGVSGTSPLGLRSHRSVPGIRRLAAIAAAAAAVIVGLLAIDLIRGARNGPVPLFAAVQEKMQRSENVSYRLSVWSLGKWQECTEGTTSSWFMRKDYGDSIIVWDIRGGKNGFAKLLLYPAERRAVIARAVYPESRCDSCRHRRPNPVDRLAAWHKTKGFSYVRKERLRGVNTAIYERCSNPDKRETQRMTAWVDLETELPVRLEMVSPRSGPSSDKYPYGMRLSDFQLESSRPTSWIDVKPGEPCVIYDDFKWNFSPDTSYFSTTPPAGYSTVETSLFEPADSCRTEGKAAAEILVRALSRWLSISGNVFPDDMTDLTDTTKVKALLIAKFRRGGDPAEEFRAAYEVADVLEPNAGAFRFHVLEHGQIDVNYAGQGATFGDSKRIICWLKDKNKPPCPGRSENGRYFSIYGDLHIAASATPPPVPVGQ